MPLRENKIDVGTIGSMPCEVSLNQVLIKVANAKVTNLATSRYQKFRYGIRELQPLIKTNPSFYETMLLLWRKENFAQWETRRNDVPKDVYTHVRCCMAAQHRIASCLVKLAKKENRNV